MEDSHIIFCLMFKLPIVFLVMADDHEYRLVKNLMKGYDKRIRPSLNASEPLNVTFGLALSQIIDVDEKNQILTSNCWLNQIWIDYTLRWDPDQYGGIKVVRLPFNSVWRPDILLYNNADVATFFSSISSNVIVTSDGNVTWLSMVIFKSSCSINVRYFPFDEQNCSMLFASWTYDGFQVNLIMTTAEGDVSNYIPNSEWTLKRLIVQRNVVFYSCCAEPYPDITFYILIRRRPLFYIFNMVLPCILMTLVSLLGFYIPSDSGEKVTMGITTLLSMTVFMMLVAENMPPTSDVLPLIGLYYGITICIVSTATGMTVITLNIHHKGYRGREVPKVVKNICFGMLAKVFCMRIQSPRQTPCNKYAPDYSGRGSPYIRFRLANQHEMEQSPHEPQVMDFRPDMEKKTIGKVNVKMESEGKKRNGGISSNFTSRIHAMSGKEGESRDKFEQKFMEVLNKVSQTIEKNEIRLTLQDRREIIKIEWQQVAQVIDRLLLLSFVLITVALTCGIMFQAPSSDD